MLAETGTALMYVCICNAFTEKKVKGLLDQGVRSAAQVYAGLGCAPQCGKCVPYVRDMIRDHAAANDAAPRAAAAAE